MLCFLGVGTALCHRRNEDGNVLWSVGKNNAKSMTVANGGNAIEDRRSVGLVQSALGLSRIFSWRGQGVDLEYYLTSMLLRFIFTFDNTLFYF